MSEHTSIIEDIGATLKKAREAKDISIASAALHTNLSVMVITRLEANQFAELGAPVFVKGYLTQYGRFLGISRPALDQAFNQLSPADVAIKLNNVNVAAQQRSLRRHRWGLWLVILMLLGLIGMILSQVMVSDSWLMRQFHSTFAENRREDSVLEGTTQPASEQNLVLEIAGQTFTPVDETAGDPSMRTSKQDGALSLESLDLAPTQPSSGTALALPEETTMPSQEPTTVMISPSENTTTVVETQSESTPAAIVLTAVKDSWFEVKDKNGKTVHKKLMKSGEVIELSNDGAPYEFSLGLPDAVRLTVNGEAKAWGPYKTSRSARRFKVGL